MPAPVDLRSDTVTRPTDAMRKAMYEAECGDDGWGDDRTVVELQELYASMVDREAGLFVPSGTMGNQVVLRTLARPGTLVLAGGRQHVVLYENGAGARNAGVQFVPLPDEDGTVDPVLVEDAVTGRDHHHPAPSLVVIENTHMPANGAPWPLDALAAAGAACARAALPLHVDGARLFNASVALGVAPAACVGSATTVMSCLSKGLGAPIGSMLAGPADFIAAARVERHLLGGQLRQVGIIAAAGIVALRTMIDRLVEDHDRARRLGEAVAERYPGAIDPASVRTNIVVFAHEDTAAFCRHLADEGVLAATIAPGVVRLVTHLDVDDAGIDRACTAIATAP